MASKEFEIVDVTMQNIDEMGMFCKKTKRNTRVSKQAEVAYKVIPGRFKIQVAYGG